jgi:hypothetical protein
VDTTAPGYAAPQARDNGPDPDRVTIHDS